MEREHENRKGIVRWANRCGLAFAFLGLLLGFYFGGYPGFLFFKQFAWFPVGLELRTYFGLASGFLMGLLIFWAFGTITGAFVWWLLHGRRIQEKADTDE